MSSAFVLPGCRWQYLSHGQLLLLQCLQLPPEQYGADTQDLQHTGWHTEGHTRDQRCTDCCIAILSCCLSAELLHECITDTLVIIKGKYLYVSFSLQKSLFMQPTSSVRSLPWKLTFCTSCQACTPPLGKHSLCYTVEVCHEVIQAQILKWPQSWYWYLLKHFMTCVVTMM